MVALGQGADADALIALGIIPVGMSAAAKEKDGLQPWTAAALGSRQIKVIHDADGLPVEQVAALEPDLIVATTHVEYDKDRSRLERIAEVIGPTTTAHDETWRQGTIRVGTAVGMANEAAQLVRGIEAKLATVRQEHPEWAGKTYTNGPVPGPGEVWTISPTTDVSAILLGELDLALLPKVTVLSSPYPGRAQISLEQLQLLDADVVMLNYFSEEGPSLESSPLFLQLPAVKRGAYVRLGNDIAIGIAFPSVLSIPYVLDRITSNHTGAEHGMSLTRLFDADKG